MVLGIFHGSIPEQLIGTKYPFEICSKFFFLTDIFRSTVSNNTGLHGFVLGQMRVISEVIFPNQNWLITSEIFEVMYAINMSSRMVLYMTFFSKVMAILR